MNELHCNDFNIDFDFNIFRLESKKIDTIELKAQDFIILYNDGMIENLVILVELDDGCYKLIYNGELLSQAYTSLEVIKYDDNVNNDIYCLQNTHRCDCINYGILIENTTPEDVISNMEYLSDIVGNYTYR